MIDARDITVGYRRDQPVVTGWNATVAVGEMVAIVGASGSGKSTLLYVLGTLLRPWSGSLRIGDLTVDNLGDAARSHIRSNRIGFVFQDALLDPRRSVLDNIVEGAVYRGAERGPSLARGKAVLSQLGVDVEPRRRATDLSGGQAQRVALARALLFDPEIILADEPTGNLDRGNALAVEEVLLARARAGAAVVIVTHDEDLAGRCDRQYRI